MQPNPHKIESKRFFIGCLALILCLALITPATWAVESGMLSITAEGVTAARAIFAQHPDKKVRNDDYLAMKMVAPEYWHYSVMNPDYDIGVLVTRTFRIYTNYYVNARTQHMDALLKQAAEDGATQVVNLGAGYDSRAYRFRDAMPAVRFFEIDLPAMIQEKKRRVELALGQLPGDVVYVPIDFNTQNIPGELKKAGYDPGRKTFFIWEGADLLHFRRGRGQHLAVHRAVGTGQFGGLRLHAAGSHPGRFQALPRCPICVILGCACRRTVHLRDR